MKAEMNTGAAGPTGETAVQCEEGRCDAPARWRLWSPTVRRTGADCKGMLCDQHAAKAAMFAIRDAASPPELREAAVNILGALVERYGRFGHKVPGLSLAAAIIFHDECRRRRDRAWELLHAADDGATLPKRDGLSADFALANARVLAAARVVGLTNWSATQGAQHA